MKEKRNWQNVKRLLTVQFIICLLVTVGIGCVIGTNQAVSAFLGGMVALAPSVIFAKKFFQNQGARAARKIVKNFYLGEFLKMISSALMFSLVFIFYKVAPLAFFLTYITVVVTHWLAPLIIDNKHRLESD